MEPTLTVAVPVSGGRVARDLPTWGHQAIWRWHGNDEPDASFRFVNAELFPISPACTVDNLTAALAESLLRHDGLRTVFHREDGQLWQSSEDSGSIDLEVYHVPADQAGYAAWEIGQEMGTRHWTMAQWPVRVSAVGTEGAFTYLVVSFNRLVLDSGAVTLFAEEVVQRATGGEALTDEPWQPVDEARFERSAEGLARNDQAMQHWRRVLTEAPPSLFDLPLLEPEMPRYRRTELVSPALGRAVRWMHRTWRVPPAGVLLAAISALFGYHTGHRRIAVNVMAGNRPDRQRRQLVATLTGEGLFSLDLDQADLPFDRLTRAAYQASGQAQRFGFCDPESVVSLQDELGLTRGAYVGVELYVNDVTLYDYGQEPDPTPDELATLAEQTTVKDTGGMPRSPTGLDIRMHLTVQRDRDMPLTLFYDTRYVSSATMHEFLRGLERIVVGAACGELDVDALCRSTGVTPVDRGPSWIRCGDGWVDVEASREIWQQVVGELLPATVATLAAEEEPGAPGQARLVGYLVGTESAKLDDLHRRCVLALGLRTDVRAPAWYRVVAAPVAQPEDPASWHGAPVLLEGDGR